MPPRARAPSRGRPFPEAELVLAGRAWERGRLRHVEVGFGEGGTIVAVGRDLRARHRRDLGDAVLIPSATDIHVHLREPGGPDSGENIASGTMQAVLGGIGTVGEMPNTDPPTTSVERLESKGSRVRGRAACDVVLYAAARTSASIPTLGRVAGAFKLYGSPTTGIEEPPPLGSWRELLDAVRATDLPLSVHAEDPGKFVPGGPAPISLADWAAARPGVAESEAVRELLSVAGWTRLNVAHVTMSATAERIRHAGFCSEATPHHLLLALENREIGARGKVNPPLRSERERAALYEEFANGRIPILASDHAPHPLEQKERPFGEAPSGMPGVETMLPLFLARVAAGSLSLPVLQAAACDRPARWLGLASGRLAPGFRGHVMAVDFRRKVSLQDRRLHGDCGWSAFEGWEAVFPFEHYLDGELVVRDGEYVGRPAGRVLRPEFARP
jgi:dihydroorotase